MIGDDGVGNIIEGLATPRTEIKDTGFIRVIQKPKINIHGIANIDKITTLFAIAITITAFKQASFSLFPYLIIHVVGDAFP